MTEEVYYDWWTYFVWSPLASAGNVPATYLAAIAASGRVEVVGLGAALPAGSVLVVFTGLRTL